ncbi:MAG TPA: hypothetical protein VFN18_09760 [Solirubrobacterales bacterium]|nr:hypothetical protein [Solirubrobacterales bacterium]
MVGRISTAAFPIALGVAIDISGIGGPTATLIAWLLAFLTLLCIGGNWLWRRRKPSWAGRVQSWNALAGDLTHFISKRRAELRGISNGWEAPGVARLLRRTGNADMRRIHDADTMAIYKEKYGDRVQRALGELCTAGLLGEGEAGILASPSDALAIERLAERLRDLAAHGARLSIAPISE